jgi:hypothetical protein
MLTLPESITRGYGASCWSKVIQSDPTIAQSLHQPKFKKSILEIYGHTVVQTKSKGRKKNLVS